MFFYSVQNYKCKKWILILLTLYIDDIHFEKKKNVRKPLNIVDINILFERNHVNKNMTWRLLSRKLSISNQFTEYVCMYIYIVI